MKSSRETQERHRGAVGSSAEPTGRRERDLIDAIRDAYAPSRLVPSRRVALEKELWERIERRNRRPLLRPMLAVVTFAAAVLWFARTPVDDRPVTLAAAVEDTWEYELLFAEEALEDSLGWEESPRVPERFASVQALLESDD
jgi:hypothetical protein